MQKLLIPTSVVELREGTQDIEVTFPDNTRFVQRRDMNYRLGHIVLGPEGVPEYPAVRTSPSHMMVEAAIHRYTTAHGKFPIDLLAA